VWQLKVLFQIREPSLVAANGMVKSAQVTNRTIVR
jgi:hypothetical protein